MGWFSKPLNEDALRKAAKWMGTQTGKHSICEWRVALRVMLVGEGVKPEDVDRVIEYLLQ